MGLFDRNQNEAAYVGGKKHWTDVIKNSGPGELLIWRQPEEDFNTNSTLVVMPGEEAIFIKNGVVEQTFDNGTYKLTTENYPFLSRLRNAFSGGISSFNCVVYFVRKAHTMEMRWGTASPIQVRDPIMMIATSLQARGAYKVQVENGVKFLTKLLGNNVPFAMQEELDKYFASEFQQHIKASIAKYVKNSQQEILGICSEQDVLAENMKPLLQEILDDYGLKLVSFSIMGLDIPENDPNRAKLEDAFAQKGVMNILGDDWARLQSSEILRDLANNPGAGGAAAAGAGIGMGAAAGGVFGSMAQQMFAPMNPGQQGQMNGQMGGQTGQNQMQGGMSGRFTQRNPAQAQNMAPNMGSNMAPEGVNAATGGAPETVCPKCGAVAAPGTKFCGQCGTPLNQKVFCTNCGAEMAPGTRFCGQCGKERVQ